MSRYQFARILFILCIFTAGWGEGNIVQGQIKYGVGLVPKMSGGDPVEQQLYGIVGEMKQIDYVYTVESADDMLNKLIKIGGIRKLKYLVLAGHGSRETPGIKWGSEDMVPEDVSMEWQTQQNKIAGRLKLDPSKTQRSPAEIDKFISNTTKRIAQLNNLADVMAPDATILMINCSAAATDRGQNFVKSLGKALLSKRGGKIVASRKDISLSSRDSVLQRTWTYILTGQSLQPGDLLVSGDWAQFTFDPKYKRGVLLAGPINIPADQSEPTGLGIVLEVDKKYMIVGQGECSLWNGQNDGCDSVFRYNSPLEPNGGEIIKWCQLALFDPDKHLCELLQAEPQYTTTHEYEGVITGIGKELRARVHDGGSYSDNHDALQVSVYEAVPIL